MKKIKFYNKLVRDKMREVIEKNDKKRAVLTHLSPDQHLLELQKKLVEEVAEYLDGNDPMELADVLEVVRGIARIKHDDPTLEKTLALANQKRDERGGFDEGLYLIYTESSADGKASVIDGPNLSREVGNSAHNVG